MPTTEKFWLLSFKAKVDVWKDERDGLMLPWCADASYTNQSGNEICVACGEGETEEEALEDLREKLAARCYTVQEDHMMKVSDGSGS